MAMHTRDTTESDVPVRHAITRIIEKYRWKLLGLEEFIPQIEAYLEQNPTSNPGAAALHVYSTCLYRACCGTQGMEAQTQAFTELGQYLYSISFRRDASLTPEQRQDAVNDVLLVVWQNLDTYLVPSAFLANAGYALMNVLRQQHSYRRLIVPLEHAEALPCVSVLEDPLEAALRSDLQRTIQRCFRRMVRFRPRSRNQIATVWLKYMRDFDDQAISNYFAQSVATVHVLRCRGLKKLRADPIIKLVRSEAA